MREPLFRLVLANPEAHESILGFPWIEVLEVMPQHVSRAAYDGDTEGESAYRFQAHYLVRTDSGIHWLAGGDLEPEMDEGVYVECRDLMVWDADTKCLKRVVSTCVNGISLQLNVEEWGEQHGEILSDMHGRDCDCQNCARERVKAKRGARKAKKTATRKRG